MKFLLDESVEYRLLPYLQQLGHNVTAIGYNYPAGLKDRAVLAIANQEKRILITNDRDFGELIFRQQLTHYGVIFFRLKEASIQTKLARLGEVLHLYADQLHHFLVITSKRVRVRQVVKEFAA